MVRIGPYCDGWHGHGGVQTIRCAAFWHDARFLRATSIASASELVRKKRKAHRLVERPHPFIHQVEDLRRCREQADIV